MKIYDFNYAAENVVVDDEDDFIPMTFSFRTFLYKVVKWIKSYYKDLKI